MWRVVLDNTNDSDLEAVHLYQTCCHAGPESHCNTKSRKHNKNKCKGPSKIEVANDKMLSCERIASTDELIALNAAYATNV